MHIKVPHLKWHKITLNDIVTLHELSLMTFILPNIIESYPKWYKYTLNDIHVTQIKMPCTKWHEKALNDRLILKWHACYSENDHNNLLNLPIKPQGTTLQVYLSECTNKISDLKQRNQAILLWHAVMKLACLPITLFSKMPHAHLGL